jgi:hypothetical protein
MTSTVTQPVIGTEASSCALDRMIAAGSSAKRVGFTADVTLRASRPAKVPLREPATKAAARPDCQDMGMWELLDCAACAILAAQISYDLPGLGVAAECRVRLPGPDGLPFLCIGPEHP